MDRSQAEFTAAALAGLELAAAFANGVALLKADFAELLLLPAQALAERHPRDPRLAQLLGLAARAVGDGPLAHAAFRRAAALAPQDALIAHSHARASLEAGHPATALFEMARSLSPSDGTVIQGLAAALVAEGRAEDAVALTDELLDANPLWMEGHATAAQVRGQLDLDVLATIDAALTARPSDAALVRLRISTLLKARRTAEAFEASSAAMGPLGSPSWLRFLSGHAASELGDIATADAAFAASPVPATPAEIALLARHAIRAARAEQAAAMIEPWLARDPEGALWPYASLAWRLTGDPRAEWLEGEPALIGVYDLAERIGDIRGLGATLRALHTAREAPLDQSVRGGTQTDGNLLLRADPAIQALRRLLLETVAAHVDQLPGPRDGHPALLTRRQPLRIAGSWSVRLRGAGFHADHVHSQGWLSSALYIALPNSLGSAEPASDHAGWLSIGECRELAPDLAPLRLIEPKPGQLVLFPSTMWHGTRPFSAGERLTIAFDIARPRQD